MSGVVERVTLGCGLEPFDGTHLKCNSCNSLFPSQLSLPEVLLQHSVKNTRHRCSNRSQSSEIHLISENIQNGFPKFCANSFWTKNENLTNGLLWSACGQKHVGNEGLIGCVLCDRTDHGVCPSFGEKVNLIDRIGATCASHNPVLHFLPTLHQFAFQLMTVGNLAKMCREDIREPFCSVRYISGPEVSNFDEVIKSMDGREEVSLRRNTLDVTLRWLNESGEIEVYAVGGQSADQILYNFAN